MELSVERRDECTILRVEGELDAYTSPALRVRLDELIGSEVPRVVLELGRISFINSAGVRTILGAASRFETQGGRLAISCPSKFCKDVFGTIGMQRVVECHETEEEAIASLLGGQQGA